MDRQEILKKVDHTLLTQTATWEEIKEICDDAIKYQTASICIPPSYVKEAKAYVQDQMAVCTVIGFPNGYNTTAVKKAETEDALKNGADVTLNYGSDFNLSDYVDVTDNFDGVIQPQVEGSIDNHKEDGVQTLTIKATDSSGNESSAQLNVAVKDTEAPKISLSKSEVSVNVGASLDLSNYLSSATDNKDGDVKGKVSIPSVSTSKAGSYTATYTVSDAAGNQGSASLTVKVNAVRTSSKKGSAATVTTSRPNYYGTSVVGAAYSRLGCPYVWGAEGPNTFDCSGLVKWCYAKAGKSLPHSSSAMKSSGTVISISSAQPGDILWRPGHVAIYIGGNQYIHAPQTGDVVKVSSGVSSFTCAIRP